MPLSKAQIAKLLELVGQTQDDNLDCDGCFERVAEFAEAELEGRSLCEAMSAVKRHLDACPCCADEYQALLDGLKGMNLDATSGP